MEEEDNATVTATAPLWANMTVTVAPEAGNSTAGGHFDVNLVSFITGVIVISGVIFSSLILDIIIIERFFGSVDSSDCNY